MSKSIPLLVDTGQVINGKFLSHGNTFTCDSLFFWFGLFFFPLLEGYAESTDVHFVTDLE